MATRKLIIGCGYLGGRVARRWIAQGDTVFSLTRSADRAAEFRKSGIEPVVGNVTDPASLATLPEVDTILYAVGLDRGSAQSQRDVYVGGLGNVLNRVAGKFRRFLHTSSTSVYGQNTGEWVDESSECRPERENGKVCLEAEQLLRSRIPASNILRLAGIYGSSRLAARIAELRAGLVLEGNPDAWLNLVHVDDAVAAILACERRGAPGATYLVCDDQPIRRMEYYKLLASLIGAPLPRTGGFPPFVRGGQAGSGEAVAVAPSAELPAGNLNKRCCNRRLHEELQVNLRYPTVRVGLPMALTAAAGSTTGP
ncbi:MAG: SDR family oxidoreductase [Deltaproteobacteria bacterium]